LGLIIEAITGNTWEHEVRTRIFEPLGLEHSTFVSDKKIWGTTMTEGYFKTPQGYVSILDIPNRPSPSTAWANGGVVSSLSDLMTFASALFDGRLVSKESLVEMTTPISEEPETGRLYGLGGATMKMLPPGAFGMGGDAEAYHSFFAGIRGTKYVVAALVNTSQGDAIGPSFMALDYIRALPAAGQKPATSAP
jgi:D-alanyl-D-alanine carboxypeptidase